MSLWKASVPALFLMANAVVAGMPSAAAQGVTPQSTETLDAAALTARLDAGARKGSPISLVLHLIGGTAETPQTRITMVRDPKADFNRVTVTVLRDGFQDDSVRGDWHEFTLTRAANGAWRIDTARRAYRCWRGGSRGYAARRCP